jgi:hypothetical protein
MTNLTKMFLDDERMPTDVTWNLIDYSGKWVIVRSFNEAMNWVLQNGVPSYISFDHDLGEMDGHDSLSGYDFAKWLVEHDLDTGAIPGEFNFAVHSKNPVGAQNIYMLLSNYMRNR